jgi:hypothetical protein
MRNADLTAPDGPPLSLSLWADAARIARAAGDVLDATRDLAATARPTLSTLDTEPDWFGSLPYSLALAMSHAAGLVDAETAVERLVTALERDADGLYQVAFSLLAADGAASKRLGGT